MLLALLWRHYNKSQWLNWFLSGLKIGFWQKDRILINVYTLKINNQVNWNISGALNLWNKIIFYCLHTAAVCLFAINSKALHGFLCGFHQLSILSDIWKRLCIKELATWNAHISFKNICVLVKNVEEIIQIVYENSNISNILST